MKPAAIGCRPLRYCLKQPKLPNDPLLHTYHASTFSTKSASTPIASARSIKRNITPAGSHTSLQMPRYPHAARRDAFCQRQHKEIMRFCTHSPLTVAYQMVGIISRLSTTCTRLRLNPARVLSLTQRRRLGVT